MPPIKAPITARLGRKSSSRAKRVAAVWSAAKMSCRFDRNCGFGTSAAAAAASVNSYWKKACIKLCTFSPRLNHYLSREKKRKQLTRSTHTVARPARTHTAVRLGEAFNLRASATLRQSESTDEMRAKRLDGASMYFPPTILRCISQPQQYTAHSSLKTTEQSAAGKKTLPRSGSYSPSSANAICPSRAPVCVRVTARRRLLPTPNVKFVARALLRRNSARRGASAIGRTRSRDVIRNEYGADPPLTVRLTIREIYSRQPHMTLQAHRLSLSTAVFFSAQIAPATALTTPAWPFIVSPRQPATAITLKREPNGGAQPTA